MVVVVAEYYTTSEDGPWVQVSTKIWNGYFQDRQALLIWCEIIYFSDFLS